jgi:hypothetical protein
MRARESLAWVPSRLAEVLEYLADGSGGKVSGRQMRSPARQGAAGSDCNTSAASRRTAGFPSAAARPR